MPTISVIVPVYKVEPYLRRCVESILNQSFSDLELILVDDGSPDSCGAICDEYAMIDSRVHVIHQENGGLSAARNAGMDWVYANSDSQYLTFIDSDDWVHKEYISIMYGAAEKNDAPLVMCDMFPISYITEDKPISAVSCYFMDAEQAYVSYYDLGIRAWCKLIHRSLMEDVRFPVGKLHEDAYVTHIIHFAAKRIAVCDVPLYYYFENPNSITRVKWSERRLDEMEGHELRLAYLLENGYEKAYVRELESYCLIMFAQAQDLRILSKEDASYCAYSSAIRPKMMAAFREARKHGLYPYCEENVWIYELAYPIKPIWVLRNIMMKFFR